MAGSERALDPAWQGTQRRETASPSAEPASQVVIDVTDAAVARNGPPAIGLATASAGPASTGPARLRPLALLFAVNALNVADAALTMLWIEMGIAVEANPVVEAIGLPAKLVGVAVGSYVVYRLRPRWLLVPAAALTAVCGYHVVGAATVLAG